MRCTLLTRQHMALDINIIHGHAISNEMHPQLQPKKTKAALDQVAIAFNITNVKMIF